MNYPLTIDSSTKDILLFLIKRYINEFFNNIYYSFINNIYVQKVILIWMNNIYLLHLCFVIVITLFYALYMISNYKRFNNFKLIEYDILLIFSFIGTIILVNANNFLIAFLSIEVQSLCFYVLSTLKRKSTYSTEAGLKYFILSALSTSFFLLGSSLLYGLYGTIDFKSLNYLFQIESNEYFSIEILSIFFIFISLFFKLGVAPFHNWMPDVYEGAPSPTSFIFATLGKIGIFFLLLKLILILPKEYFIDIKLFSNFLKESSNSQGFLLVNLQTIFLIISFISFIIGSLSTLKQIKLKRFLAYSTISHMGFILLGLSLFNIKAFIASIFYFIVYFLSSIFLWNLSNIYFLDINKFKPTKIKYLSQFLNLKTTNNLFSFIISSFLFSMAGVPPFVGFFSKFFIFVNAASQGLYIYVIISIIISVITAFYYISLIIKIYFNNFSYIKVYCLNINKLEASVLSILWLLIILLFFEPFFLLDFLYLFLFKN